MRPQPVMPSRSLTSAAMRTLGCVRQRDQPAPPRPLRPSADHEQARCRRAHGVGKSRLLPHEDGSIIPVDFKSEHRIIVGDAAMLGGNDPSGAPVQDEDETAIFPDPDHIRRVDGSAGWYDLANKRRQCPDQRRWGVIQPSDDRHITRQQPAGRDFVGRRPNDGRGHDDNCDKSCSKRVFHSRRGRIPNIAQVRPQSVLPAQRACSSPVRRARILRAAFFF